MIHTNYIKMSRNCKKVLNILKDGKLHYNRDMWDVLSGGFALAARIWDLRNYKDEDGKYIYKIESGNPEHFNKVRQSKGDWYYQLKDYSGNHHINQVHQEIINNMFGASYYKNIKLT